MGRAIDLLLSFISRLFAAMFLATITRDDMGMSVTAVRIDALSAAGVLFVTVAAASLLKRRK
jgi:hypothetical protein